MLWWTLVACGGCGGPGVDSPDADSAVESRPDSPPDSDEPPVIRNVLLVIADDFGVDAASFDPADPCYAHGPVEGDPVMPNVAELCRSGVVFTQAWAQPTCSPSRASLLTGRLPYRTGVGGPVREDDAIKISADELTLPRALELSGTGHATTNIGKWHLSIDPDDPNRLGWDHFAGLLYGTLESYDAWEKNDDGALSLETAYATTWAIDEATAWIDNRAEDEPWVVWLAMNAPHTPFHVPPEDLHDRDLPPFEEGMDSAPYVAAMSEAMDHELGRLFTHLKDTGQWEETVVVFVGDNGTERGVYDDPFPDGRQKGTVTVGGTWVPLIVVGPGIEGGRELDALVGVEDLFPTILELLGVNLPALLSDQGVLIDGRSLVPLLDGSTTSSQRDYLTAHLFFDRAAIVEGAHGIRDEQWGLLCAETERSALFDLSVDPYMLNDLSGDEDYEATLVRMRGALRTRVHAPVCPNDEDEAE
ncbi:MAG: sulfatase-like hydrolase/transferase [Proteobacteria bacterium]|nr:sulfatase-like hydrolase/transferase [Pseudomonadota bacterium]MCP4916730.1 sulfatase-like hydrolase/transferase [Pseudomonadota bacterium]